MNKEYIDRKVKNCNELVSNATSDKQRDVYQRYLEHWSSIKPTKTKKSTKKVEPKATPKEIPEIPKPEPKIDPKQIDKSKNKPEPKNKTESDFKNKSELIE